jgi:hypothetical protein
MPATQPITADDAAIAKALGDAHLPSLIAALVHITGRPDGGSEGYRP